jgi:hypothetical protein
MCIRVAGGIYTVGTSYLVSDKEGEGKGGAERREV